MTLEPHPFAEAFPMMSDREYAELVADIKANGLHEEISLYQGKILDGRNRYKALVELGIDPEGHIRDEDEGFFNDERALALVITKNLIRRHLDESARSMIVARLTSLRPDQEADGVPIGTAAALMNVSRRSAFRARKVIQKGTPELIEAVDRGEIKVSKAAKQIDEAAHVTDGQHCPCPLCADDHDPSAPIDKDESANVEKLEKSDGEINIILDAAEQINALHDPAPRSSKQHKLQSEIHEGHALAMLMGIRNLKQWLAAELGGDNLRQLGDHVKLLIAELDARAPLIVTEEETEARKAQRGNTPNAHFLLRADEALAWAEFKGKIDDRSLNAARATASAWCKLAEQMESAKATVRSKPKASPTRNAKKAVRHDL